MSHSLTSDKQIIEYRITPAEAYRIIRNCAGCGEKSIYESTGCFRINANGSRLDIWLIYQCLKCKHSYNLTVHERLKSNALDEADYRRFMDNDYEMALHYGLDKNIFKHNKVEITRDEVNYELNRLKCGEIFETSRSQYLLLHNPYGLKIRTEKVLAEIFKISRSKIRKIAAVIEYPKYIGQKTIIEISDMIKEAEIEPRKQAENVRQELLSEKCLQREL
jgi:hypothetical protein